MGLRAAREMFLSNISHIEILFVILRRQQTGELTKSANFCSIIKTEGAVCSVLTEMKVILLTFQNIDHLKSPKTKIFTHEKNNRRSDQNFV